jgi:hypothetical protein
MAIPNIIHIVAMNDAVAILAYAIIVTAGFAYAITVGIFKSIILPDDLATIGAFAICIIPTIVTDRIAVRVGLFGVCVFYRFAAVGACYPAEFDIIGMPGDAIGTDMNARLADASAVFNKQLARIDEMGKAGMHGNAATGTDVPALVFFDNGIFACDVCMPEFGDVLQMLRGEFVDRHWFSLSWKR